MSKKLRILKRVRDAESATSEGFESKSKKARREAAAALRGWR